MGTRKQFGANFADYTARSGLPTSSLVRERSRVQSSVAAPSFPTRKVQLDRAFEADYGVIERRVLASYLVQASAPKRTLDGDRLGTVTGRLAKSVQSYFDEAFYEAITGPKPPVRLGDRWAGMSPLGKPHRIYRVENQHGTGMYHVWDRFALNENSERHPTPHHDSRLMQAGWEAFKARYYSDVYFGFSSLDQLRSWVYQDRWREELYSHGYNIHVYEADEALLGDTQAVFVKKLARRVGGVHIITMKETA